MSSTYVWAHGLCAGVWRKVLLTHSFALLATMAAELRVMPSQSRTEALGYDEIDANTCFWSKELPDLGLVQDLKLPFRIYVLACEPRMSGGPRTIYTGLSMEAQIACRIRSDFAQGPLAPHFC